MASVPSQEGQLGQTLTRIFYRYVVFILLGCLGLGACISLGGTAYLANLLVESQAIQQAQSTIQIVQAADKLHQKPETASTPLDPGIAGEVARLTPSSYWDMLSQRLQGQTDYFLRVYHPQARADSQANEPQDRFGQDARTFLSQNPQSAYSRQDTVGGQRYFRYATVVRNVDKTQQILEVTQSIEQPLKKTQQGLWLMGLSLLGVSSLILGSVTFMLKGLRTLNQSLKFQLQNQNQARKKLVTVDDLTELATRRQFHKALNDEWRRMQRRTQDLSLIFCRIDFFDEFKETYGAQAGKVCVRVIAQAIQSNVHRVGDLAARYDSSSFAILLPHTNEVQAVKIVAKITDAVYGLKIEHSSSPVNARVTLSTGVATLIPSAHRKSEQLISMANTALVAAQKKGHNCFVVNSPSSTQA